MSPLDNEQRKFLLKLARQAIEKAVQRGELEVVDAERVEGRLGEPGGAFVTLRHGKLLRGCIGHLQAGNTPLAQAVAWAAQSASLEDPRFERVRPEEVAELTIEISVLTPFEPMAAEDVVIGKHGLLIQQGNRRGLLLPQVATEHGLSRERFLEETCVKAGLGRDAWREATTHIFGFTAEVFSEEELISHK